MKQTDINLPLGILDFEFSHTLGQKQTLEIWPDPCTVILALYSDPFIAIITGLILHVPGLNNSIFKIDSWNETLLCFGIASLVLIIPIRKIIYSRYQDKKDINDY